MRGARLRRNEQGTITDNLIIKGNNLLALHSLKKEFAGKVKLIYIDPPYNTGSDSFKYNDSFNHSTWLTFMKNRLEIARVLLSNSGSIFINIDDKELGYLKVLLDEVFGRENFVFMGSIKRSGATGHKAINPTPIAATDYIIVFAKNKKDWVYVPQYIERPVDKAYDRFIENFDEGYEDWKFETLKVIQERLGFKSNEDIIAKYADRIVRFAEPDYKGVGQETRGLIDESKSNKEKIFRQKREGHKDIFLLNGQRILFYKDKLREINGKVVTAELLTNFWSDIPFQGIAKEGGIVLKKGKKPESLLKRILEMATERGDIMLDFQLGSGTSCAVAHKMGRQYLGLEQLDYGNHDSVVRLNNVINGDSSGISKLVNWKGGGEFIYLELKKYNQTFIEKIEAASGTDELLNIWEEMKAKSFLNYNVDIKKQDEHLEEFKALTVNEQKRHLIEILDKNQLYVNLSSMEDKDYEVTEEEKNFTKDFYGIE